MAPYRIVNEPFTACRSGVKHRVWAVHAKFPSSLAREISALPGAPRDCYLGNNETEKKKRKRALANWDPLNSPLSLRSTRVQQDYGHGRERENGGETLPSTCLRQAAVNKVMMLYWLPTSRLIRLLEFRNIAWLTFTSHMAKSLLQPIPEN